MDPTQQNGQDLADSKAASAQARERLMSELKTAIDAAEGWLQEDDSVSASSVGDPASAARTQFQDTLSTARQDFQQLQHSLQERGRGAARSAGAYVQENPWKSVGLGAALGVIVGLLIARK